jgi:hypothetical protein
LFAELASLQGRASTDSGVDARNHVVKVFVAQYQPWHQVEIARLYGLDDSAFAPGDQEHPVTDAEVIESSELDRASKNCTVGPDIIDQEQVSRSQR